MNSIENQTDRQVEGTPKSADLKLPKETSFSHSRDLRERYDIQVSKQKYMSLHDFILSLDLDHTVLSLVQREKQEIGNFIHFFDVEIQHASLENGPLKWALRKRFHDFIALDKALNKELVDNKKIPKARIPQFSEFYNTKAEGVADMFMDAAEHYLNALLESQEIRQNSIELYEFIELSLIPFANDKDKIKEGYLKKRSGGRFKKNKFKIYCSMLWSSWQERWFRLTQEGIIYAINSSSTRPREMLLFDQSFRIEYGKKATGVKTGITLKTPGRILNLQANDIFQALDWVAQIQQAAKSSPYTKMNRYLSFAPVREPTNYCKWYVDAEGYFEELHDVLLQAKKEVFITDWWLSPEVALKRPVADPESENRLDKVLARIANNGVKVYIIVYHEVKMVMYNDSEHTKKTLEAMSPNITVLRHPSEPFFSWSHHEKLVVVDQQIGFIGGFDLCFGRWDTSSHPLHDPAMQEGKGETFQGQDYANPRLLDFKNVRDHEHPLIDKLSTPRMPFHDAMIKVIGPVVADLSRHFIQYWNHVEVDVYGKEEEAPLPQQVVVPPPLDEDAQRRENVQEKFRGAFRKIFGMRTFANALQNKTPKNGEQEPLVGPAAGHALALKRAQSTLPSVQNNNRFGTFQQLSYQQIIGSTHHLGEPKPKDEFNVTIHKENIDKNAMKTPESLSFKNHLMDGENHVHENADANANSLPAYEEKDVLIKGKTENAQEPRFASKIKNGLLRKPQEEEKGEGEGEGEKMNPIVKRALLSLNDKRKIKTLHHINQPKPVPNPEEEKKFKDKYSNLLKSIRDKEKEFDHDVQMSQSRKKQQQGIQEPEKGKLDKQLSDNFYQKNMLQLLFNPESKQPKGTCAVQMVRSAAKWSLGLNSSDGGIENSIQNAYIEIIQNSKSFVYIENQFFMSSTAGKVVKNEVAKALLYRIEKAHAAKEKFRVLVFLPLLPAFEGEVIDSKAALLRIQMHWQYMTICRGGESIYEELRNKGIVPEDYIQFYGLRTHGRMLNGQPATEMIYIHSKILIADDDILLIGSANINDRSLQGSRDSEIAMIFEDSKKMTSYMDDVEVQVGEFACTFRRRLMAEHLGMTETEVEDPLNDEFIEKMNDIAQVNTDTYREIFACYPDDNVKTLDELEEFGKIADLSKYDELAPKIQGHVVWFPLEFLENEQLKPPMSSMEYYIPDQTFV